MNRAFLIIGIPAVIVSLAWITAGWGLRASIPAAIGMAIVAIVALLVWRKRRRPEAQR